jgi:F0F1-type ATP synthase assembly protein I
MSTSMTAAPNQPHDADTAITLLQDLASTTWRMIVPTGLLAGLGIFVDLSLHTAPWFSLASIPLGLGLSVLLIKRQLRRVK